MPSSGQEYNLKRVEYNGTNVAVICQNDNGPCPLLAICNTLLLKSLVEIPRSTSKVSESTLLGMLAGYILDRHNSVTCANIQRNIDDTIQLLPKLTTGIDVNLKFYATDAFEYTAECAVFDLVGINLLHGWVVDNQDTETAQAFGTKSYNDVLDLLVSAVGDGQLADSPLLSARSLPDLLSSLRLSSFKAQRGSRAMTADSQHIGEQAQQTGEAAMEHAAQAPTPLEGTPGGAVSAAHAASSEADSELERAVALSLMPLTPLQTPPANGADTFTTTSASPQLDTPAPSTPTAQDELDIRDVLEECIAHVAAHDEGDDNNTHGAAGEQAAVQLIADEPAVAREAESNAAQTNAAAGQGSGLMSRRFSSHDAARHPPADPDAAAETVHLEAASNDAAASLDVEGVAGPRAGTALDPPAQDGDVFVLAQADPQAAGPATPFDRRDAPAASTSGAAVAASREQSESVRLIQRFLTDNMSQLTIAGLCMLHDVMKEGELAVFFRNNHFNTLLKRDRALYILVTDQGYQLESGVVWEKLDNVEGDTTFYNSEFVTYKQHVANRQAETEEYLARLALSEQVEAAASNNPSAHGPGQDILQGPASTQGVGPAVDTTQSDHDLALALYLQQEEQHRAEEEARVQRNLQAQAGAPPQPQQQQHTQPRVETWADRAGRGNPAMPSQQGQPDPSAGSRTGGMAALSSAASRLSARMSGKSQDASKKSDCSIM